MHLKVAHTSRRSARFFSMTTDSAAAPTSSAQSLVTDEERPPPPPTWVDKHVPAWLVPYMKIARIDRPIGTYLLFYPCAVSTGECTIRACCSSQNHFNLEALAKNKHENYIVARVNTSMVHTF